MGSDQSKPKHNLQPTHVQMRVWNARGPNICHVSLYLPQKFLYMSFWPNESVSGLSALKSVSYTSSTYEDDKHNEGRRKEDELLQHESLNIDVDAMIKCWNEHVTKQQYCLADFNCADAVLKVLSAGHYGFERFDEYNSAGRVVVPDDDDEDFLIKICNRIERFKLSGLFSSVTRYVK